jgi:Na+/proline symporter
MLSAMEGNEEAELERALETLERSKVQEQELRQEAASLIALSDPGADTNDINYIFLSFVINYLPVGLVGLILAAILSASMSSTAAELNALASVSVIDIYRRVFKPGKSDRHYLKVSKIVSVFWGAYAIGFAMFANSLGSLIEAVNILGSLFYGSILGIFIIAFSFKKIGGDATFIAAIVAEVVVLTCFFFSEIPYLWFNVIGCAVLIAVAHLLNPLFSPERGRV